MKRNKNPLTRKLLTGLLVPVSCIATAAMLLTVLHTDGAQPDRIIKADAPVEVFDRNLNKLLSTQLGGTATDVQHIYALQDSDIVAPEPNAECFGTATSPQEMIGVLQAAKELLNINSTLFTEDTPIKNGSAINYYLDDTIFAVSWKQSVNGCTYTFSEVKIAHPSQLRRFLSEGKYNSGILHTTTEMAASVNAVTASSGDYYSYRRAGIVVNNGVVHRANGELLDTCYIDNAGNLQFTFARQIDGMNQVQSFVEENDVRFSLSFGPVMLINGMNTVPFYYNSGEINKDYPRSALCQWDELHYILVCANHEAPDYQLVTIREFADSLHAMGIPTAYALDGGQSAAIVFNDELINTVSYGSQRKISDIIYFATAIPNQ